MKVWIIVLLLLIPIVHADNALEVRKSNLETRANEFMAQMNAIIDFAQNKSINTTVLEGLKSDFETKLKEALKTDNKDDLLSKEKEMRDIADKFRKAVKKILKDYITDLKEVIKDIKSKETKSITKEIFNEIKKATNKTESSEKEQDVEQARETLRNAFSGFGGFFSKIKEFFTETTKNMSDNK